MILLVDAGNSRVKWRVVSAGETLAQGECLSAQADRLRQDWSGLALSAAVVSCVAGEELAATMAAQSRLPVERIHRLVPRRELHGLINHYEPPESLGPDRYAALVACHRLALGDCVLVGVGTALTADMLTREGAFLGGCIIPGPELMRTALVEGTALVGAGLGREEGGASDDWPCTTAAAVSTGITLALAGVVEGMRVRIERQVGRQARIVLSGGARAWVKPGLTAPCLEMENLVLEGLAWIARDLGCDA